MMLGKNIFFASLILVLFSTTVLASTDMVFAKKTLNRWIDPVIMDGRLARETLGKPIANVRLYAFRDGAFKPIRYQIDEMTGENGDWIFPDPGPPLPNGELSNKKLDSWDKLLFMADDTGDRVSKEAWVSGCTSGSEIEVIDPVTNEKGWCYLLYFSSNPPAQSSLPDYCHEDYKNNIEESDYWHIENINTKDGLHSTFTKCYSIPEKAGGNGKNFIDRIKIRPTIKIAFGKVSIRVNEETLKSNELALKQGPIRILHRVEQYALLPGGIKAVRAVIDLAFYRNIVATPVTFQLPFRMDRIVSSFIIRFGMDYNENVIGSRTYNSSNPEGCLIDGKMTDCEKNWNPAFDNWRLISGDFGTYMTRTVLTPEIEKYAKISMGLIDDITLKNPPESIPGTIGCLYQDWDIGSAPKGTYYMFLEFYFPPHYKPGDEAKYVTFRDNLVKIRSGNQEEINQFSITASLGKKYK